MKPPKKARRIKKTKAFEIFAGGVCSKRACVLGLIFAAAARGRRRERVSSKGIQRFLLQIAHAARALKEMFFLFSFFVLLLSDLR